MTRREKRLAYLSAAIISAAALSWLMSSDSPKPEAAASTQPVDRTPLPQATPRTPTAPTAGAAAANALAGKPARPRSFVFSQARLSRLLSARATHALTPVALVADPFREIAVRTPEADAQGGDPSGQRSAAAAGKRLPVLSGVFLSQGARGARLDERLCFEGEELTDGVRLIEVSAQGVDLEIDGRQVHVPYVPTALRTESR